MALKTQAEMFEPLVAGRYTGQPFQLWHQLGKSWREDAVLDVTLNSEAVVRADGSTDLTPALDDEIGEALEARDHVRMLALTDEAERLGVDPELCNLTRRALRVQYPS